MLGHNLKSCGFGQPETELMHCMNDAQLFAKNVKDHSENDCWFTIISQWFSHCQRQYGI